MIGLVRDLEGRLERRHLVATLLIHTNVLETVSYSASLAAAVHPKIHFYKTRRFKMGTSPNNLSWHHQAQVAVKTRPLWRCWDVQFGGSMPAHAP